MKRPGLRARALVAAASVAAGALGLAVPALGYRTEGARWPEGVIRYYNAAHDQAWAVAQAVNAWNTSGARVHFVAVSRASAQLEIRYLPGRSCERAEATVGFGPRRTVGIWSARSVPSSCTSGWAATALAHELGHVLGLAHEDRGCAAMNSRGDESGGSRCPRPQPWEWRCRLLEHDDVAGAVALYGGTIRARGTATCPLYTGISAPGLARAVVDPPGQVQLLVRRPSSPSIPSYLLARYRSDEGYALAWGRETCPTRIDLRVTGRYRWPPASGGLVEIRRPLPTSPGRHCLSLWSVDAFARPSDRPLTVVVDVP